jgi:hypothetical protein
VSPDPKAAQPLQFDRAVSTTAKTDTAAPAEGVTCVVCAKTIADKYFDINGQPTCDRCKQQVARQAETPTGFGVFGRAVLFGLGATLLGAALYYAVIAITDFEIGIVAIAIGFMVGYAIRMATDNRGGLRFQILAIVLTYWAVGLAYTPFIFTGDSQSQEEAQIAPASTEPVATELVAAEPAATDPTSTEPAPEAKPMGAMGLLLATGLLFAVSFALPVLSVFSSLPGGLISAAIIAFGMQQAWRMTAAPEIVITGPFRIARKMAS